MMGSTPQKAILQSAPWVILALIMFVAAWLRRFQMPEAQRRQLRLFSLVALAILTTFAFAEVQRHEGLSFNQRYLLELLPPAAIAFAWALDGLRLRWQPLLVGALWGVLLVVLILFVTPIGGGPQDSLWLARMHALLKLPLLCSATLGLLWFLARSRENIRPIRPLLAAGAGLCLAWGLTLHVLEDVRASHSLRAKKRAETEALGRVLTSGSALVAYTGSKDSAVPLLFDRDIVILDMRADDGKDAPTLIGELLGRGRRVFLLEDGVPGELLARARAGWEVVRIANPGTQLKELRVKPAGQLD
jgi:hypothetical protein